MKTMTFREWLEIREGLWLNDDKALEGLAKLPQPKPKKLPLTQAVRPAKPLVRPVLRKVQSHQRKTDDRKGRPF